ncbi:glutamate-1-semialdehyde 2,1-aminomutase [Kribbella sp. NPDC048928]|uniref:glutamate-1-semialdehyde 2,1-aminomutase n=1 Tax=Kribbella sp. NPDC048928 TaxID=3364111 RepID=UPI003721DD52
MKSFTRSDAANKRLHDVIPGGAHTYAKGVDQFPEGMAPVIDHGNGAHVWDLDGNKYIEYGAGLRAVSLGHVHPKVLEGVRRELDRGSNFVRPSILELEAAERFLASVPTADMVKFCKNGSDATTAAIKLARAVTGRPLVAVCSDHAFFSVDDWFITRTAMNAGIPDAIDELTVAFPYGDLAATEELFVRHEGRVACLILEAATHQDPPAGYLEQLRDLAHRHGALLVFDEMITGLRFSAAGAQGLYGVTPDLSTFGKALGNGFSVAALAGKREFMERGGLRDDRERVFLLSTTHGAETHALAAAVAVLGIYAEENVAAQLYEIGAELAVGVRQAAEAAGVGSHVVLRGRPSNLVFATLDENFAPSQQYRTLFLRELILGGVLGPSFVVSAALTSTDIARTVEVVADACATYRQALEAGDPQSWTGGRPVAPVFRRYA